MTTFEKMQVLTHAIADAQFKAFPLDHWCVKVGERWVPVTDFPDSIRPLSPGDILEAKVDRLLALGGDERLLGVMLPDGVSIPRDDYFYVLAMMNASQLSMGEIFSKLVRHFQKSA